MRNHPLNYSRRHWMGMSVDAFLRASNTFERRAAQEQSEKEQREWEEAQRRERERGGR